MSSTSEEERKRKLLLDSLKDKLAEKRPISVAMPPCADILLSLIRISQLNITSGKETRDDVIDYFEDYFKFKRHDIFPEDSEEWKLLRNLFLCREDTGDIAHEHKEEEVSAIASLPNYLHTCLPPTCVTLNGNRVKDRKVTTTGIRRLFIGDLVWLFYFERLGIFKMLGVILDDFAIKGKFPISNAILSTLILEIMTRQTKSGISSTVRDRDNSYRRCLGWSSDVGRKLGSETETVINTAFNSVFHRFIQIALGYYKEKRLASAIQGPSGPSTINPSTATIVTIADTIDLLKKGFIPFNYSRNYYNTLSGLVWIIAGISIIKSLRTTLGIASEYTNPFQYISAAYDILIAKRPVTPTQTNRYKLHKECANDARDILLDLEVLNFDNRDELRVWLDAVEDRIEGYRTVYRELVGVDLGASEVIISETGHSKIEQQVVNK